MNREELNGNGKTRKGRQPLPLLGQEVTLIGAWPGMRLMPECSEAIIKEAEGFGSHHRTHWPK